MTLKNTSAIALPIIAAILVYYFYLNTSDSNNLQAPTSRDSTSNITTPSSTPIPSPQNKKVRETGVKKTERKSLGALQRDVIKIFGDSEASRSQILMEAKRGTNYCYLLGATPPSPEEIASLRKAIATLKSQTSKEDAEQFDKYLNKMIDRYDPFGTEGKKAIYILIPEDYQNKAISGMTFPIDDFDAVKKAFDPNEPVAKLPYSNVKPYIRDDTKILSRFQSLIKTE